MVDKMLFYSNKEGTMRDFITLIPKLSAEYEVALATDDYLMQRQLSIHKFLLVNPETYDYDVLVTNNKYYKDKEHLTLSSLKEVLA